MATERPPRSDLLASNGRRLRDVIAPNLKVLFCGINPGLYSAAVGHHFARPGNRFWRALRSGGFTERTVGRDPRDRRLPNRVCEASRHPGATAGTPWSIQPLGLAESQRFERELNLQTSLAPSEDSAAPHTARARG